MTMSDQPHYMMELTEQPSKVTGSSDPSPNNYGDMGLVYIFIEFRVGFMSQEIILEILGNLALHEILHKQISSSNGLVKLIVDQFFLDDVPLLCHKKVLRMDWSN